VLVEVVSKGGAALVNPALDGSGMGLELIAERAHALGGELTAGPTGQDAWAVRAALPREVAR
jgi:signal transduction histidine kinase